MSASLVGSEMCIRDRFRRNPQCAMCNPQSAIVMRNPDSAAMRNPHSAIPVSYTHLTLPTICSV
eukprot:3195440-Alexandrium_andersonii.AAC.1